MRDHPHRFTAVIAAVLLAALTLLAAWPAPVAAAQGPPGHIEIRRGGETVYSTPEPAGAARVLFVGNSLTYFNEVPWLTQRVVESKRPEPPVVTRFAGRSGMSLEEHWNRGEAPRLLRDQHWDWIVLQEQSHRPFLEPAKHEEYLRRFVALAREHGTRPVIFETWPPQAEPERRADLAAAYRRLAADLDVPLVPIGTAWETARQAGIPLYRDVIHSNLAGAYLTACVVAADLFDVDPRGTVHTFPTDFDRVPQARRSLAEETLSDDLARRLQEIAWRTVHPASARSSTQ